MTGFSVRVAQLCAAASAVEQLSDDAACWLRRLDALAEDVLVAGWTGAAASAYAQHWQRWRCAAQCALAALDEMGVGLRQAASAYACGEQAATGAFTRIAS